ncbi:MAG: MarC family protein [Candidatus Binatia bacterium]
MVEVIFEAAKGQQMMELVSFAILSFGSLFVIVDPPAAVPAFLAMTEGNSPDERLRMARLASVITFFVLLAFSLAGLSILGFFGVTVPAFGIAGGIILLKVALDMLQGYQTALKETPEERTEGVAKHDIAITPLAVPMLSGPGAITTVILLSNEATSLVHSAILVFNIFFVSLLTFVVLRIAALYSWVFGEIMLKIITRLLGLLLAAIAVQFILNGIEGVGKFW